VHIDYITGGYFSYKNTCVKTCPEGFGPTSRKGRTCAKCNPVCPLDCVTVVQGDSLIPAEMGCTYAKGNIVLVGSGSEINSSF